MDRRNTENVELPEKIMELLEEERRRLARDIHDGPAQYLTNTSMRLEVLKRLVQSGRSDDTLRELDRLQAIMRGAINDVRRMIFDLRPTFLDRGIHDAISLYADRFSQTFGITVEICGDWSNLALPHAAEVAVFRVFQEALNNIHKHAAATQVHVTLTNGDSCCVITVRDNGKGFDSAVPSKTSYGLQGMRERVSLIQGHVEIVSAPQEGTCVTCEIPLQPA